MSKNADLLELRASIRTVYKPKETNPEIRIERRGRTLEHDDFYWQRTTA